MINEVINYLTFIPWILIFAKNCLDKLRSKDKLTFKYLKKNFFKIFRLDLLLLIIIFYYFASFNKDFVHKYLFAIINLYLFVNSFYESKTNVKKNNLKKELILVLIMVIIPIGYYILSHNLLLTYKLMFIYLYFINIIILIIKRLILRN